MDRRRAGASSVTPVLVAEANKSSKSFPERQRETAEYLADMILEFRNLARSMQLYTVMVPLEYAYYEAFGFANRVEVPAHEIERIKVLAKAGAEMDSDPDRSGT
ncbi:hypothetical protein [Aestuariivirga sp.]|uniref:hypothetical protein n=1 Tax=Aestuariivirga sp. TaxID=2650926 RepID=UPI003BA8DB80